MVTSQRVFILNCRTFRNATLKKYSFTHCRRFFRGEKALVNPLFSACSMYAHPYAHPKGGKGTAPPNNGKNGYAPPNVGVCVGISRRALRASRTR